MKGQVQVEPRPIAKARGLAARGLAVRNPMPEAVSVLSSSKSMDNIRHHATT